MKPIIKVKKLNPNAILPKYESKKASGLDLSCIEDVILNPGEVTPVRTGLAVELPKGTEMQIRPRSGIAKNNSLLIANSPGTIDEDYRGEIIILMLNYGGEDVLFKAGSRIAQGIISPVIRTEVVEVEELSTTKRNDGGFSSTGV